MVESESGSESTFAEFERLRRIIVRLAASTCLVAFLALLLLSATQSWSSENPVIPWFHDLFRITGSIALVLVVGRWSVSGVLHLAGRRV